MKKNDLHIGEIIKKKVEEKGFTISEFAEKICCSRTNVYSIFNSQSIDTNKLIKISEVLCHNFFEDFVTLHNNCKKHPEISLNITIKLNENTIKDFYISK